MKKYITILSIISLSFSACSLKEVYKPKVVVGDWNKYAPMGSEIVDRASNIALLDNSKVLTKSGVLNIKIDKNERVVSQSDGWILSATIDGKLTITSQKDTSVKKIFDLKKTIASASIGDGMLAVLFADNEMALYDLESKATLLKEQGGESVASDMRIVNPYFMNGLVIFSTLDGKIIIISTETKKILRTVLISSSDFFNNVIDFKLFNNKIIAATDTKILSLTKKEIREKYEIRNIAYDDSNIYITTKQGEIISLTSDLEVISKIKLPFAHFLGLISSGNYLYALEKEGYIIIVDKKNFSYRVKKVDIDDGFVFTGSNLFYVNDKKILVE